MPYYLYTITLKRLVKVAQLYNIDYPHISPLIWLYSRAIKQAYIYINWTTIGSIIWGACSAP